MIDAGMTGQTVELLQQLIRNTCVNDGTLASGQEVRTADVLKTYLAGSGLDLEVYEPAWAPGRASLVARIEGTDPSAPTLCCATGTGTRCARTISSPRTAAR
jgi:acetylornithine deacetylase/succinyl-diaminopimelate desuccinylase-like protein